jgi:hypothetical protein
MITRNDIARSTRDLGPDSWIADSFDDGDPGFTLLDSLIRSSLFQGSDKGLPGNANAWYLNYLMNQNT